MIDLEIMKRSGYVKMTEQTHSPFGNVFGIITTIDWRMAKFGDGNTRLSVFLVWSIFFFSDFGKCGFLGPW
jgi:hypothetical protein